MNKVNTLLNLFEAIEPSQNKEWGFWGTVKSNFDMNDSMAKTIWDYMGDKLTHILQAKSPEVREFLDATYGRHLADELTFHCDKKGDVNALKKGIDDWSKQSKSKWVIKAFKEL